MNVLTRVFFSGYNGLLALQIWITLFVLFTLAVFWL
jgi:hypothetical protein